MIILIISNNNNNNNNNSNTSATNGSNTILGLKPGLEFSHVPTRTRGSNPNFKPKEARATGQKNTRPNGNPV